jgi:hypothetical protein
MNDLAFYVCGLGASVCLLVFGVLILVSPARYLEFGKQVGKLFGMDPSIVQLKPGANWDWRIMGSILALVGVFLLHKFIQVALLDLR